MLTISIDATHESYKLSWSTSQEKDTQEDTFSVFADLLSDLLPAVADLEFECTQDVSEFFEPNKHLNWFLSITLTFAAPKPVQVDVKYASSTGITVHDALNIFIERLRKEPNMQDPCLPDHLYHMKIGEWRVVSKKLRDVIPHEVIHYGEYEGQPFMRKLEVDVLEEVDGCIIPWIGTHKNVLNWWRLADGTAVGWNESPSRGWGFPVVKIPVPE